MTDYDVLVDGYAATPADGWQVTWIDRAAGVARLANGSTSTLVVVEGSDHDWQVTVRGRRIPVSVRTWRERILAEAESASRAAGGPTEIRATLPGLVVVIEVEEGHVVEEDQPLLTLEAMKMQNEVRAPRAGRIAAIAISTGEAVATGQLLIRIE
jgi:biotin carboxyl carrier protein